MPHLRLAKMFTRGVAEDRGMWFELGRGSVGTTRLAREAATHWSLNRQRHSALRAVNNPKRSATSGHKMITGTRCSLGYSAP